MIDRQWLDERGWRTELLAPLTSPEDRAASLARLEQALIAFAPVLRPLVVEVTMCWKEVEFALSSQAFEWPGRHIYAVRGAVPRLSVRPFHAPVPIETVPAIDRDLIAAELLVDAPPDPGVKKDWLEVRTLAVAMRALEPIDAIELDKVAAEIRPYEPGWFAGPVGDRHFDAVPPAELLLTSDGRVGLRLAVHWSRWFLMDTPERKLIENGIAALLGQGWVVE